MNTQPVVPATDRAPTPSLAAGSSGPRSRIRSCSCSLSPRLRVDHPDGLGPRRPRPDAGQAGRAPAPGRSVTQVIAAARPTRTSSSASLAGIRSTPATADPIWVSHTKAMATPSSSRIGCATADRRNQPTRDGVGARLSGGRDNRWSAHDLTLVATPCRCRRPPSRIPTDRLARPAYALRPMPNRALGG